MLSILKVGNYLQIRNEVRKNPGGKKSKCKYKILTTRELITYIADLTGRFVFSWVNHKRKSRHQWSEICQN